MPIEGQLNVHALNDGVTALDLVAAMSQSEPARDRRPASVAIDLHVTR